MSLYVFQSNHSGEAYVWPGDRSYLVVLPPWSDFQNVATIYNGCNGNPELEQEFSTLDNLIWTLNRFPSREDLFEATDCICCILNVSCYWIFMNSNRIVRFLHFCLNRSFNSWKILFTFKTYCTSRLSSRHAHFRFTYRDVYQNQGWLFDSHYIFN